MTSKLRSRFFRGERMRLSRILGRFSRVCPLPLHAILADVVQDLMQENQVLRDLLRSLSGFIGEGAGGLLPRLGWDLNDFNNFLNRSETDSAWESYQRHKQDGRPGDSSAGPSSGLGQKRTAEDDPLGRTKRARGLDHNGADDASADPFHTPPVLVPLGSGTSPVGSNGLYTSANRPTQSESTLLTELMRGTSGSPMFMAPTPPGASNQFATPSNSAAAATYSYPGVSMNNNMSTGATPPAMSMNVGSNSQMVGSQATVQSNNDDDDPKKLEAYKLIQCVKPLRIFASCSKRFVVLVITWTITSAIVLTAFRLRSDLHLFRGNHISSADPVSSSFIAGTAS